MPQFAVPEQFGGLSLRQLQQQGQQVGRPDIVASLLGIGEADPLTAGQMFNVTVPEGIDPAGSAEFNFLRSGFIPGEQFRQQEQQAFQEEQRGRLGEFFGRVQEVPAQLEAVRQAIGLPEAYETFGAAGETARGISDVVRDIPQSVLQALEGRGVSAGQIAGRGAAEIRGLSPSLEAATRGLETSGATLENLLSQYQTRVGEIFTPLEIEGGMLGDNIAQEFDLFKTKIGADLDRELELIRERGLTDRAEMDRAIKLAEMEAATDQGEFRDLGDRVALINPFTGEEITSFSKGLGPTRGEGTDIESAFQKAIGTLFEQIRGTQGGGGSARIIP